MMAKKVMFSFWFIFALLVSGLVFSSCDKDDEPNQEVKEPEEEEDDPFLTFDAGVIINGVKWATRNVDKPGTFATTPENFGMFYQWNREAGWSSTNPMINSNGETTWNAAVPEGTEWEKSNDPSPAGWRVPTLAEIESLLDTDRVISEWTTKNGVNGRRFTDRTSGNSLFLPTASFRCCSGMLDISDISWGNYWSSSMYNSSDWSAWSILFDSYYANMSLLCRHQGLLVRSVAE